MPHKALDVAKALLHYAKEYGRPITNLHLQKLLYYAQGFSYAMTGHELFADDMYAWKYGPAVGYMSTITLMLRIRLRQRKST